MARTPLSRRQRCNREILTAEGLRLSLTLASRGSRLVALLLDLGMMFVTILITGSLLRARIAIKVSMPFIRGIITSTTAMA